MSGPDGQTRPASSFPFREDCWSEDETRALVDAWGTRYLELNRGNLRQKHWEEVADAVNAHQICIGAGAGKRPRRTDVQCKNRIDTLKKKYKMEKGKISDGTLASSKWPFYPRLDFLIGPAAAAAAAGGSGGKKASPPVAVPLPLRKAAASPALPKALIARSPPKAKRPAAEDLGLKRSFESNYNNSSSYYNGSSGMEADSWSSESSETGGGRREVVGGEGEAEGFRYLARAIERFGEVYERVEEAKQRQMLELEKQRIEFAKELEFQRMQLFVDSQVQLEKMKRARQGSAAPENYL